MNIKIKIIETGEIQNWTIEQVIEEINRDRSEVWTDYTIDDWREGWFEWVDGEFYSIVKERKD